MQLTTFLYLVSKFSHNEKIIIMIVLFLGILIVSCNKEKSLQEYIVDSWQTTYLKIEMPTHNKTDSLHTYEDNFNNNPKLIAQSKYYKDGTFTAWFINTKGEKVSESNGKWNIKNDSLFVKFYYNKKEMKVGYYIVKTNDGFLGKSIYDWDNDGDFDDFLIMKTKRIKTE